MVMHYLLHWIFLLSITNFTHAYHIEHILPFVSSKTTSLLKQQSQSTAEVFDEELSLCLQDVDINYLVKTISKGLHYPMKKSATKKQQLIDMHCQQLAWYIFGFAIAGFTSNTFQVQHLRLANAVLLAWLFPPHRAHCRKHKSIWKLSASISAILALHDLARLNPIKIFLRLMLGGFGQHIQYCMLFHNFMTRSWQAYVLIVFQCIWQPHSIKVESKHNTTEPIACTYYDWCSQQKVWYLGKALIIRSYDSSMGYCERYKEHLENTHRPCKPEHQERKYVTWRQAWKGEFRMIPFTWQVESSILLYELFLVRFLQAPIQNRVKVHRYRTERFRPWKRLREKLTKEKELALNQCHMLSRPGELKDEKFWMRRQFGVASFYQAWKKYFSNYGIKRAQLIDFCYRAGAVPMSVLLLAQKHQKNSYKKLWATRQARYLALAIWTNSLYLPVHLGGRVQRKVERFLDTSVLSRGTKGIMRIATHKLHNFLLVKSFWMSFLRELRFSGRYVLSVFLKRRVKIIQVKGPDLRKDITTHVQIAKKFDPSIVDLLTNDEKAFFDNWEDVQSCRCYWDTPVEHSIEVQQKLLYDELQKMMWKFQLQDQPILHKYLYTCHMVEFTSNSKAQLDILSTRPEIPKHMVAVTLDKDPKRMCISSVVGYWYRLYKGFCCDPDYYCPQYSSTPSSLALRRQQVVEEFFPSRVSKKQFTEKNLPRAYHTYKGKCLACFPGHGLACKKPGHTHHREIISDFTTVLNHFSGHRRRFNSKKSKPTEKKQNWGSP